MPAMPMVPLPMPAAPVLSLPFIPAESASPSKSASNPTLPPQTNTPPARSFLPAPPRRDEPRTQFILFARETNLPQQFRTAGIVANQIEIRVHVNLQPSRLVAWDSL